MKLILDVTNTEPLTGSLTNPETGTVVLVAGWMSLMSAITDLARRQPGEPANVPPR
jgi:hypothetical protein